ncbi:recombination regulator RecX [Kitasatospora sp. NPDC018619]|uniref:recombination regulator RecX n=1 Tax=unclassified Kitasatospora TaxID=2633591 RepID=UPI00378A01ED
MTQHDTVGGGPAGPEDDDYGPPDWFAAVAEEPEPAPVAPRAPRSRRGRRSTSQWASGPEPESDLAPARAVRGAAPGPEPAETPVEALGLVSASELPTGRRRRRSALAAEELDAAGPDTAGLEAAGFDTAPPAGAGRRGGGEAAGHGGAVASAPRRGGRRGRPATGPSEQEGAGRASRRQAEESADPETRARDVCLRLLTGAAKTRKQLADALRKREIPDEVADGVLTRLEEVGLIDDAAFAAAWVESRHAVRGLSRRALAQELRTKGVAADLVEQAVARLDHDDETDAARALVERKLRSTRGLDTQVRTRRLVGMLARRGYSEGLAFRVVRSALEEEWSEPAGRE